MARRPGRLQALGWLSLFLAFPLGVWLAATLRAGAARKSVSNFSFEPLVVAVSAIAVFCGWFLLARKGLRPSVGLALLILLACAALAVQHFVPSLHE